MKWLSWVLLVFLAACGGGGGDQVSSKVPDVALLFVSGHNFPPDGKPSYSYLHMDVGPSIVADLRSSGYSVEENYYVDDAYPVNGYGGYQSIVAKMRQVRDQYVPGGTRVVMVAHSHGGVWAHAAMTEVSDLPVTAIVDLDVSSYGWDTVDHNSQSAFIGGDPRNRYTINALNSCPKYPQASSEATAKYDVEDVVSMNVKYAFEVRSGENALGVGFENYDEKWNIRSNGGVDGLYCYFSNTSHSEVHQPAGETVAVVKTWLRDVLSQP